VRISARALASHPRRFRGACKLPSSKSPPPSASTLHEGFVSTYENECEGDWALGPNDGYYFQFLLNHVISARGVDAGFGIFSDLDWLLSKWRATGARSMLADCQYFPDRPFASAISAIVTNGSNNVDLAGLASALGTLRSLSRYAFSNNGPQKYVLVAGTGTMRLGNTLVFASETIGLELARAGLGLISGGWQGVDHVVCREYVNQLRRDQLPSNGRLIHIIPQGTTPDLWNLEGFSQEGDLEFASDSAAASRRSVERANAVVMIGGAGGTFDIYEDARRLGKPVYPIFGTGGDAGRAYRLLIQIRPALRGLLERNIRHKRDAREIARAITEIELTDPSSQGDPRGQRDKEISDSKEDFESKSKKLQDINFGRQPLRATSRQVPAHESSKSASSSGKREGKTASKKKISKPRKKK